EVSGIISVVLDHRSLGVSAYSMGAGTRHVLALRRGSGYCAGADHLQRRRSAEAAVRMTPSNPAAASVSGQLFRRGPADDDARINVSHTTPAVRMRAGGVALIGTFLVRPPAARAQTMDPIILESLQNERDEGYIQVFPDDHRFDNDITAYPRWPRLDLPDRLMRTS